MLQISFAMINLLLMPHHIRNVIAVKIYFDKFKSGSNAQAIWSIKIYRDNPCQAGKFEQPEKGAPRPFAAGEGGGSWLERLAGPGPA